MAPEEGEPVEVDIALDGEPVQLAEEALAEVQGLLPSQDLVSQQKSQRGDVRTVPRLTRKISLHLTADDNMSLDLAMWTISDPVPCSSSHSTVSLCSLSPTTSNKLLMFSSFMVTRSSSVRCCSFSSELHTQVWPTLGQIVQLSGIRQ